LNARKTVNLVQTVERAGVDFVSVHGRTVKQRKEPPNLESIALVKDCVSIPVVANGGMKTLADVHAVHERTGVDGESGASSVF
jgi:tRNA-dihydrouridine synthase 4